MNHNSANPAALTATSAAPNSPVTVHKPTQFGFIGQYRRELEKSMSRVYASRRLNRPPRAMARRIFPDVLEIPKLPLGFANAAALVYLNGPCKGRACNSEWPC